MHAITQSCVLVLWYFTFSFVRGQGCTSDALISTNIDKKLDSTKLQERYTDGQTVTLPCIVGHTGFFRARCENTEWRVLGRPKQCELKSCGHPGEAPFADFHLVLGDDFVFGAQIKYECNNGYRMANIMAYQNCHNNGWDGVLPVCEAIKCPVVQVEDNVLVIGQNEEVTFGNVLQFECQSADYILDGKSDIYCNEDGKWSDSVPKCSELKCYPPNIEHGYVIGSSTVYKKDQTLRFGCELSYRPVPGRTPKCGKQGMRAEWSPTPLCEPIQCKLSQAKLTGTSYTPVGKNIFLPGETVTVTCTNQYWTLTTHMDSAVIKCKDTGEWEAVPLCEERYCRLPPPGEYYVDNYRRNHFRLGSTLSYKCNHGHGKKDDAVQATCTKDGWKPNPLCEEITCQPQNIENVVKGEYREKYKYKQQIAYQCAPNYEPSTSHMTAVCERTGWSTKPACKAIAGTCKLPIIDNGFVVGAERSNSIANGGTTYYSCNNGYKPATQSWWGAITCKDGRQTLQPKCIDNAHCGELPKIPNAIVEAHDDTYANNENAFFTCDPGYVAQGSYITCHNGEWTLPNWTLCKPSGQECQAPPRVNNAIFTVPFKKRYANGSSITYECRPLYGMNLTKEHSAIVECINGEWNMTDIKHFECKKLCADPNNEGQTIQLLNRTEKPKYFDGDQIEYKCNQHMQHNQPNRKAICDMGTWKDPVACKAPHIPSGNQDEEHDSWS